MSSLAINRRIKAASELRDLCLKLGKARPLVVREYAPQYRTRNDFNGKENNDYGKYKRTN